MKKTILCLIALFMFVLPVQTGLAASGFSLANGDYYTEENDEMLLREFFKGIQLDSNYLPDQKKYELSGKNEGGSNETRVLGFTGLLTTFVFNFSGEIKGEFDPRTGEFYGTFIFKQTYDIDDGELPLRGQSYNMTGGFTGNASPKDTFVKLTFHGVNQLESGGTKEYVLNVMFEVQGALPFTAEKDSPEQGPEGIGEDSNLRIDEIATPSGYVYIRRAGSQKTEFADSQTVLYVGDTLIVPDKGAATVRLNSYHASSFFLRPGTRLTIKAKQNVFVFGEVLLNLGNAVSEWLSHEDYSEEFEMDTQRANTSIQGTVVVLKDDGAQSTLKVLEGWAEFTDTAAGTSLVLRAGEMSTADGLNASSAIPFDVTAEAEAWGFDLAEITHGVSEPLRIISVAAGNFFTLGLRQDGKVMAAGNNESGQCDVEGWTEITAISAGLQHAVGLRRDGTVVAAGINDLGQCDVRGWRDIIAVSAGYGHTVGLKADGTVVAAGYREDGQCDVDGWRDITAIAAGGWHTLGLKSDGEVVATGYNKYGQCEVADWRGIESLAAGGWNSMGIKGDGQVSSAGYGEKGQTDLGRWRSIRAISASGYHTVGLREDGTLLAAGNNDDGQCGVENFADAAQIAAGGYHTVALLEDGSLAATGNDTYGQCDLDEWWVWMLEDSPLLD